MTKEELKQKVLSDDKTMTSENFDETVEYINEYCLMNEVLEFTEKFINKGYNPSLAMRMAMYEWDL